MACIHPGENPPLGWLVPCLSVGDLDEALVFWRNLDFEVSGGEVAKQWATLRNRAAEIHLFGRTHTPKDLLNFRGGDVSALRPFFAGRGLVPDRDLGPRSVIYRDPDGREVFFDSGEDEQGAYMAGQPLSVPVAGDVHDGVGMDVGNLSWCCASSDLPATCRFYETLGLSLAGGQPEQGWAILGRGGAKIEFGERRIGCHLAVFQGMLARDTINFRGGDVAAIAATLSERGVPLGDGVRGTPDGGAWMTISDPDGRPILFDTTPAERLYSG